MKISKLQEKVIQDLNQYKIINHSNKIQLQGTKYIGLETK